MTRFLGCKIIVCFAFFAANGLCVESLQAQELPAANASAILLNLERPVNPAVFSGTSAAIVRDLVTGLTTSTSLSGDDVTLPSRTPNPGNGVLIERPLNPTDLSFALIQFDGSGLCSSTAIGRRLFLTAGHCVFDKDTHAFRNSAIVYLGYPRDDPALRFKAIKLVAFSGWTTVQDYAHDVALVEVDRDIPASVPLYNIVDDTPRCGTNRSFTRTFYEEGGPDQYFIQGTHVGCERNTMYWSIGTTHGSSGSAAVDDGTRNIYGVYSNFTSTTNRIGHDAWITRAKNCFIRNRFLAQNCNPPEGPQESVLVAHSAHIDVLNSEDFAEVLIYRTGSKSGEVAIRYATVSMSATYGRDLDNAQGILKWTDGDTSPKTVRVKLHPENDPVCERKFRVSFGNKQAGDPPGQIQSPGYTEVSIYSASRPIGERRLLAQQFIPDVNFGAILSKHIVIPSDGQALCSASGYDISSHWRDRSRGIALFQKLIHDNANAVSYDPVMSTDGSYLTRVAGPEIKTYTRGINNADIVQSSSLSFDYDRYTTWDATSSPDARSDVYVSSHNPNTKRFGILRYQRHSISGALYDKQAIWAGDGGMPSVVFSHIRVSQDGRWLFALDTQGISTFSRDADGLLKFVNRQTTAFAGWMPGLLTPSADSKFVFVTANQPGASGRLFALSVSASGALVPASAIDMPAAATALAVNPDGKEVYVLANDPNIRVLQYSVSTPNGQMAPLGDYKAGRCEGNPDLAFPGQTLVVGPEGRFLTIGAPNKGILTLRLDR